MRGRPLIVRFLADGMLGTLAKWLRVLGVDTRFLRDADDDDLVRIATEENRVLLTRDRPLAARCLELPGVEACLVEPEALEEQVALVLGRYPEARPEGEGTFTRCTLCNTPLEVADAEEARRRVPPYVASTQERFLHCPTCDKIYWAATHVEDMMRRLADLVSEGE